MFVALPHSSLTRTTCFQVEAYHNIKEIKVLGAIVYLGTDAGARQKSMLFGRSNTIKNVLAQSNIDIRRVLDVLTIGLKCGVA